MTLPRDAEEIVADSVRSVFGLDADEMTDDEALDRVMNPGAEPVPARHPERLVSLAADAGAAPRDLRVREAAEPHGRFAGPAAPHGAGVAAAHDVCRHREPDYITPRLIAANARARAVYDCAMREAWTAKNRLLELGVPLEFALYVLPNAKTLRFIESGSLLALLHKWTLRTCFNAQEEIYLASMDEIAQVRAVHPRIGRHIGPPCVIRNGLISPRCTEGSHFCGVPVWRDFPGRGAPRCWEHFHDSPAVMNRLSSE